MLKLLVQDQNCNSRKQQRWHRNKKTLTNLTLHLNFQCYFLPVQAFWQVHPQHWCNYSLNWEKVFHSCKNTWNKPAWTSSQWEVLRVRLTHCKNSRFPHSSVSDSNTQCPLSVQWVVSCSLPWDPRTPQGTPPGTVPVHSAFRSAGVWGSCFTPG